MNESTSLKLDDLKDKSWLLFKDYNEAKGKEINKNRENKFDLKNW